MVKAITIAVVHLFEVHNVGSSLIFKSGFGLYTYSFLLYFLNYGVELVLRSLIRTHLHVYFCAQCFVEISKPSSTVRFAGDFVKFS